MRNNCQYDEFRPEPLFLAGKREKVVVVELYVSLLSVSHRISEEPIDLSSQHPHPTVSGHDTEKDNKR